jgi:hypothetical protein
MDLLATAVVIEFTVSVATVKIAACVAS